MFRQAIAALVAARVAQISIMSRNPNTKARSMDILSATPVLESSPGGIARAASLISFDRKLCAKSGGKFSCIRLLFIS